VAGRRIEKSVHLHLSRNEICPLYIFNDLHGPLAWFTRSRHIWSRISHVLWTKLL